MARLSCLDYIYFIKKTSYMEKYTEVFYSKNTGTL